MKVCHPWQWVWKCNECLPAKKAKTIKKNKRKLKEHSRMHLRDLLELQPATNVSSLPEMMPS